MLTLPQALLQVHIFKAGVFLRGDVTVVSHISDSLWVGVLLGAARASVGLRPMCEAAHRSARRV